MHFPSSAYPIDGMRMSADAQPGERHFYGDMQWLFCLQGRYMGTDIPTTAFQYVDFLKNEARE